MFDTKREVKVIKPIVSLEKDSSTIKMAAYCRVSTESEEQANSFLAQFQYYNEYASSRSDVELVDIYADEGITGTCMSKREDFNRMMKDAANGRFERLLTKSVSRFARNALECIEAIRKLNSYGVTVLFENDNIDTKSMNSELILYVKSAFAQSEALAGSKRVSTAIRMKMENGDFSTYTAPYGYCLDNLQLKVVPEEAEVIKKIFDLYLQGEGVSKIVATLKKEHSDRIWTTTGVRYILTNEKYVGDSLLQKTYTPQIFPLRNRPNYGQMDKYYVNHTHEAIIERSVFEAVGKKLAEIGATQVKRTKEKYVFTGLIYCEECGWAYKRKIQNGTIYWVCSRKGVGGYKCGGINVREDLVKIAFVEMFNKLRSFEKELIDSTLKILNDIRQKMLNGNYEIAQIDSEIAAICEQNSRYAELKTLGIIDEISYLEKTASIKNRLAQLRNKRITVLNSQDEQKIVEDVRMVKDILSGLPIALIDFDRNAFDLLVDKIEVGNKDEITFIIKGGLKFKERISK